MQILCRQETIFCTRMNNNKKGAKISIPHALQQGALSCFFGTKKHNVLQRYSFLLTRQIQTIAKRHIWRKSVKNGTTTA